MKGNGAKNNELELSEQALKIVINSYTRESGVRNLKREIDKLIRKIVTVNVFADEKQKSKAKVEKAKTKKAKTKKETIKSIKLTAENISDYLGVAKYRHQQAKFKNSIGRVTGLAWTSAGGELLSIEVASLAGKGNVIKTGSLGDVMRESIQAAFTVVRSRTQALGIKHDFYENIDLHIHVPEGATPKDGPSAGIGMCTAMISELTQIPVKSSVAMTGEITLKGEVLAIGGLKEKLLVAHQRGIKTVIIPKENELYLKEVDEQVKKDLNIIAVEWIDEVLDIALEVSPTPISEANSSVSDKSILDAETSTQQTDVTTAH